MKHELMMAVAATVLATGCASTGPVGGLEPGKLVQFECEGRGFAARVEDDFSGVRLRTPEGSANLTRAENGDFKGDGWTLKTQEGLQLVHKDKVVSKACRKAV